MPENNEQKTTPWILLGPEKTKIAQKIAFFWNLRTPRSVIISEKKKVTLAAVLQTKEKGQRRGYSQTVFWHNKDGGLCG